MRTEEITVFRDARPDVASYDPAAKARLRARLVNESSKRTRTGLRSRWRLVAVGGATAALVAGPVVALQGLGDGPVEPRKAPVLGPARDDRPRPDQWSYTKTVAASSSKGVGGALFGPPDRRVTNEQWRRADGKQDASYRKGKLQVRDLGQGGQGGGSPQSDYPYLLALPDGADALLAFVNRVADTEGGPKPAGEARASRTFQIMEVWMRDAALPAKLRAAMYQVLAKIPGVRYEAGAADILGRKGVTFYRIEEGYLRSEIMVDPATHQYLGFRAIAIKNHVSHGDDMDLRSKKGQILGWGGLAKAAIVDRPGQRS